ncbi:uncharacterized protein LOC139922118 [Centroberyx gerrardi]|uniref:uncharacterized protein n=1 Tax=Centroberyx gerrardi TaxID=166262 RepID=UPI003AAE8F7A
MGANFEDVCACCCSTLFVFGCTILLVGAFPIAQITIGAVYLDECPVAPVIPVYVLVSGVAALLLTVYNALGLNVPGLCGSILMAWNFSLTLFFFIWFLFGSYHVYSIYPPNYDKTTTDPEHNVTQSNYTRDFSERDNRSNFTLENQNQERNQTLSNLSHRNRTWIKDDNQTLTNLIQALALSNANNETMGERRDRPKASRGPAALPYCDRTLYLFAFWCITLVYGFAGVGLLMLCCLFSCMKSLDCLTNFMYWREGDDGTGIVVPT